MLIFNATLLGSPNTKQTARSERPEFALAWCCLRATREARYNNRSSSPGWSSDGVAQRKWQHRRKRSCGLCGRENSVSKDSGNSKPRSKLWWKFWEINLTNWRCIDCIQTFVHLFLTKYFLEFIDFFEMSMYFVHRWLCT